MRDWRLSIWASGLVGAAAAAVLTWLLREGSQSFQAAIALADIESVPGAGWLLVFGGLVLAAILWAARIHPLIAGVPAVWFLVRFAPLLLGSVTVPAWYPEWLTYHVLVDANAVSFLTTALLSAVTVAAFVSQRRTASPTSQNEHVSA